MAVVAAVLVGTKLDDVTVSFQGGVQVNDPQGGCGLGSFNSAQSLCTYTILTCAITAGAALLLAVLMCCTCNFCGMVRTRGGGAACLQSRAAVCCTALPLPSCT